MTACAETIFLTERVPMGSSSTDSMPHGSNKASVFTELSSGTMQYCSTSMAMQANLNQL